MPLKTAFASMLLLAPAALPTQRSADTTIELSGCLRAAAEDEGFVLVDGEEHPEA